MEETTYICERCGERVPADACTMVADTILCPDCVDMYTTVCDSCGERLFLADDHGDENITLCEHCYERHYTHCEHCGRVISYSEPIMKMTMRTNRYAMTIYKLVCSRRPFTITATHRGWFSMASVAMNVSLAWNWKSTATARAARMPAKS